MRIIAQFTGAPSLGYEPGHFYELNIYESNDIWIKRDDGTGLCRYSSILAFLKNWTKIESYYVVNGLVHSGLDFASGSDQSVTAEFKNILAHKKETLEAANARRRLNNLLNDRSSEEFKALYLNERKIQNPNHLWPRNPDL